MKFEIEIHPEALKEINDLEKDYQHLIYESFRVISLEDISFVTTKPLKNELFEIKEGKTRSIYAYSKIVRRKLLILKVFLKKKPKNAC